MICGLRMGPAVSSPFRVSVVSRKPGIVTASGDGSGAAQATLDGKLILQRERNLGRLGEFETRPARPGERVDLWGTGLSADLASDGGGNSGNQTAAGAIRVLVNGTEVTLEYAGRTSGYPGLDQIAFNLPASVALSCNVDIQVRAGGNLSNLVTLATSRTDVYLAKPGIRFNEVESNLGMPGDWVEIYNPENTPMSLAGFIFRDNMDTNNYTLPVSAMVPARGFLVLEETDFVFGLGAADSVRLFRPDGTLADAY